MSMLVVYATFILIEVIGKKNKRRIELEMIFYVIGILLYRNMEYWCIAIDQLLQQSVHLFFHNLH